MDNSFKKELCLVNDNLSFTVRSPMTGLVYDFNKHRKINIVKSKDDYIYLMNEYGKRLREVDPNSDNKQIPQENLDHLLALKNKNYSKFIEPNQNGFEENNNLNEEKTIFNEKESEIEKIDSDEDGNVLIYMKNGQIKKTKPNSQKQDNDNKETPQSKIVARRKFIE